jgi:acetyltransferase-like isoleucine patch superfamily enzyme
MRIKNILRLLPVLRTYCRFLKRYNEPNAISFFDFLIFNYLPVKLICLFYNKEDYIPHNKFSTIIRGHIFVGKCTRIQQSGCYIQGRGRVFIGDYVGIAPNVTIISGNHDLCNQDVAVKKETIIGDHSWIAANSNIMAGVVLGPRTIVGAGSVVTKSFPEGYCVVAGNPAKVIKTLNPEEVVRPKDEYEFYGYLTKEKFKKYFKQYFADLKFEFDISKVSENEFFFKKKL